MRKIFLRAVSIIALVVCLVMAWLNFAGRMPEAPFKLWFLLVSVAYFILAGLSVIRKHSS